MSLALPFATPPVEARAPATVLDPTQRCAKVPIGELRMSAILMQATALLGGRRIGQLARSQPDANCYGGGSAKHESYFVGI